MLSTRAPAESQGTAAGRARPSRSGDGHADRIRPCHRCRRACLSADALGRLRPGPISHARAGEVTSTVTGSSASRSTAPVGIAHARASYCGSAPRCETRHASTPKSSSPHRNAGYGPTGAGLRDRGHQAPTTAPGTRPRPRRPAARQSPSRAGCRCPAAPLVVAPGRESSKAAFVKLADVADVETSVGSVVHHGLNRAGDREPHRALRTHGLVRIRQDRETSAYVQCGLAEGKSVRKIKALLKGATSPASSSANSKRRLAKRGSSQAVSSSATETELTRPWRGRSSPTVAQDDCDRQVTGR
jgi:hypothetical protein